MSATVDLPVPPHPVGVPDEGEPLITATVCPAGSFGRAEADRLGTLLDVLSVGASVVVLDLRVARLRSRAAADTVDRAAALEERDGHLLCLHPDPLTRRHLAASGGHAVVLDDGPRPTLPVG